MDRGDAVLAVCVCVSVFRVRRGFGMSSLGPVAVRGGEGGWDEV